MSNFFEKTNPDATIKSVLSRMATGATGMFLAKLMSGEIQKSGILIVLLWCASASLMMGVLEWQPPPWSGSTKDGSKGSVTGTIIGLGLIVLGLVTILYQWLFKAAL